MDLEGQDTEMGLFDAQDSAIVMHRDAHFGGQFAIMLDYYAQDGKGVNPDFDFERIKQLALIEQSLNQNLAGLLLSGPDAEKVAKSRETYRKLRELYETSRSKNPQALLIADLILTEDEEGTEEIEALVKEKGAIVPLLINLIKNEDFHDPLFPGYGQAPTLAIKCLGEIKDKRALITLFEALGEGDFFDDDIILEALHAIGDPAKAFLLKVVQGLPLNIDNEKAAIALVAFKDDPEVSETCFKLLLEPNVRKDIPLSTYLVLACEKLPASFQQSFLELANNPNTLKSLSLDMQAMAKLWIN
jgi:HEAT repeat protein